MGSIRAPQGRDYRNLPGVSVKYTGIVLRINGEPDAQGDIFGPGVELPDGPVLVSQDYNKEIPPAGTAIMKMEHDASGQYVKAELDIDLIPQLATKCYAVVGGHIIERDEKLIKRCKISHLALTLYPSDPTLEPLKEFPAEAPGTPRIKMRDE